MKEANGARAATARTSRAHPRLRRGSRARCKAERSRLEDKRAQLLHKREAAQAELGRIDRAVEATDELLELLAPLLAANGSEPEAADENGTTGLSAALTAEPATRCARSRALSGRDASRDEAQPAKE